MTLCLRLAVCFRLHRHSDWSSGSLQTHRGSLYLRLPGDWTRSPVGQLASWISGGDELWSQIPQPRHQTGCHWKCSVRSSSYAYHVLLQGVSCGVPLLGHAVENRKFHPGNRYVFTSGRFFCLFHNVLMCCQCILLPALIGFHDKTAVLANADFISFSSAIWILVLYIAFWRVNLSPAMSFHSFPSTGCRWKLGKVKI